MDEKNPLASVAAFHFSQQFQNQRIGNTFKSIKPSASGHADPKLQAACREMESLFLSYLLKEMRATINKSGFISGGKAEEIFTSLLDVEISKKMSDAGGIGLSSILMKQLSGQSEKKDDPGSR
ncbi:MAG: rod-binding protein [Desulfobacterales bacterium]|jgi:flagellar protein FlgJ